MKSKATFPRYLAIVLICLLCLCPFVVLLILSLNEPGSNMYDGNVLIPDFYFGNYAEGWAKSNIGRAMINSGIITLTALLLIVSLEHGRLRCCQIPEQIQPYGVQHYALLHDDSRHYQYGAALYFDD